MAFLYLDVSLAESGEIWQNLSKRPVFGQLFGQLFGVRVDIVILPARHFRVTLPEMPSEDPHLEDDILVSRDKIIEMFDPPPGRSTFFEWVNKGTVVKARGLTGYFLLNATRKKVKLPPVDVAAYRSQVASPSNRKLQLVYTALAVILPEMTAVITEIELPEVLTPSEVVQIKRIAAAHREGLLEQGDLYVQVVYCRAVLDAEKISQKLDVS